MQGLTWIARTSWNCQCLTIKRRFWTRMTRIWGWCISIQRLVILRWLECCWSSIQSQSLVTSWKKGLKRDDSRFRNTCMKIKGNLLINATFLKPITLWMTLSVYIWPKHSIKNSQPYWISDCKNLINKDYISLRKIVSLSILDPQKIKLCLKRKPNFLSWNYSKKLK